jgi:hypothetical protein
MPRDAYILRSEPVTLPDLIEAAATVDDSLTMRTLYGGVAVQFVAAQVGGNEAVLTIQSGRMLRNGDEIARLVPSAGVVDGPVWFAEAFVPWENGEIGAALLEAIRVELGATVLNPTIVEDGS